MEFLLVDSFDVGHGFLQTEEQRTSLDDVLAERFDFAHLLETVHDVGVDGDVLGDFSSFALIKLLIEYGIDPFIDVIP